MKFPKGSIVLRLISTAYLAYALGVLVKSVGDEAPASVLTWGDVIAFAFITLVTFALGYLCRMESEA